jgi:hypothetical protein
VTAAPKTSTRQTRASKIQWNEHAENKITLVETGPKEATRREPLAEKNLYVDVSPRDKQAAKGAPLKKSTLSLLAPGQKGKPVDWASFNIKARKYLHHPLSKQFDGTRYTDTREVHN